MGEKPAARCGPVHLQVICKEADIKQQPYEWVYDGLKPLLLDSVLETRKGVHISLAALYCAVARRLSCRLLPEVATRTGQPQQGGIWFIGPSSERRFWRFSARRRDFLHPATLHNSSPARQGFPHPPSSFIIINVAPPVRTLNWSSI